MLNSGMCLYSRKVIPASWCPLYFIYLPNHSSAVSLQRCAISLSRFTLSRSSNFSCSWPECRGKAPCTSKGSAEGTGSAALRWQQASEAASAPSSTTGAPPSKSSTIGTGSTRLAARQATMKTQRKSARLALRLDAEEACRWWRLGFEDDSPSQDQCGTE